MKRQQNLPGNKKPWNDVWTNAVAANMANAEPLHRPYRGWLCPTIVAALAIGFLAFLGYVMS